MCKILEEFYGSTLKHSETLCQQAIQALTTCEYRAAASYCEQLVETQPDILLHRLLLGVCYLLLEEEAAAQMTWAIALSEVEASEANILLEKLQIVLQWKFQELAQREDWQHAWVVAQHCYELTPSNPDIILQLILAACKTNWLTPKFLVDLDFWELSGAVSRDAGNLDLDNLDKVVSVVLEWDPGDRQVLDWLTSIATYLDALKLAAYRHLASEYLSYALVKKAAQIRFEVTNQIRTGDSETALNLAIDYTEAALRFNSLNFNAKYERIAICIKKADFEAATRFAAALVAECDSVQQKICTEGLLIQGLMYTPGHWDEALQHLERVYDLFKAFIRDCKTQPEMELSAVMLTRPMVFFQYSTDNPIDYRPLQNDVSRIYAENLQRTYSNKIAPFGDSFQFIVPQTNQDKRMRIGFLSEFMINHPIGLLSRWIFQHYDRDRFEFYTYLQNTTGLSESVSPFSQKWFIEPATRAQVVSGNIEQVASQIRTDSLNILIDLDSLTSARGYSLLALRVAPIQVTWLGFDSTGLPTVDYFLADPFVLPTEVSECYPEAIWRMPHTYLAIDGFEIGIPTLRRDQLGIPEDAVIYFSAQVAAKRHPDTLSWQIRILRQVPNSYLLVKGIGNSALLQAAFLRVAESEGVSPERFRFLGYDPDEPTHRANLSIADVVLDTFPYTGATTTMETLWMGIPLVTRVGQQFSSRNSYTMLRNAGIHAGIAHSAEEYIEWGVRYGRDAALRQWVRQQLREARHAAPLWNAKQFTRDLEVAFEAMWQSHLSRSIAR